jgi:hypothetical protein
VREHVAMPSSQRAYARAVVVVLASSLILARGASLMEWTSRGGRWSQEWTMHRRPLIVPSIRELTRSESSRDDPGVKCPD